MDQPPLAGEIDSSLKLLLSLLGAGDELWQFAATT